MPASALSPLTHHRRLAAALIATAALVALLAIGRPPTAARPGAPAAMSPVAATLALPLALARSGWAERPTALATAQASPSPTVTGPSPSGTPQPGTSAPGATPTASPPPATTPPPPTDTPAAPTPARPVDECAAPAPEWLYCDGFETGATWDGSMPQPTVVAEPGPFGLAANHAAQLRVPPGAGGKGLWKRLPERDRLYARWFVQWEPGHDIGARHHGPGGLGADISWYTGRSGIRPNGDEYFVSTLEPNTQVPHALIAYTYYRGMFMDCADPNGRCWGDHFPCDMGPRYCSRPEYLPTVSQAGVVTGRWYCLEQLIDAGTPVTDGARADGQLDFWIDGVRIGPWTDLWWRTVPTLKINFLWLFLYHHDGAHTEPGLLLDNVVVSTQPIGCGR